MMWIKHLDNSFIGIITRYRLLIYVLVGRDMKARYRNSLLGFFWNILNPLLFMIVYTIVFSIYFKVGGEGYPVYLLSGLLPWLWFSESIQSGTGSIMAGSAYVKTAIIPSEVLPVVSICSAFMNFVYSLPLLLIFAVIFHWEIGWSILALPAVILTQAFLSLGILLITATYNVFLRDLGYLIGHILLISFFLQPIMYPMSSVPEAIRQYYKYFPLSVLTENYHAILYHGVYPNWYGLIFVNTVAAGLIWIGTIVFNRHKDSFAEYL